MFRYLPHLEILSQLLVRLVLVAVVIGLLVVEVEELIPVLVPLMQEEVDLVDHKQALVMVVMLLLKEMMHYKIVDLVVGDTVVLLLQHQQVKVVLVSFLSLIQPKYLKT